MRVIYKVFNNGNVIECYDFSNNEFICNGKSYNVEHKDLKLINLVKYTHYWKESKINILTRGFYIYIEEFDEIKEFLFESEVPVNFSEFAYEIKKIIREVK